MTSIRTAIIDLMTAHPTLSSAGLHFRGRDKFWQDPEYLKSCRAEMLTERFFNEVLLCEDFITRHGIERGASSYRMKHLVEDESRTYIHNGAFIVAAIICEYVPVLHPTPNPSFKKLPKPRPAAARGAFEKVADALLD